MSANVATLPAPAKRSLIVSLAERYGMEPAAFEKTIRATVMPSQHSVEEFAACLLVANEHGLNPITREIYFMRAKSGGIQPIVGVDGWAHIINRHPDFDGMEFVDHLKDEKLTAVTCKMFRKDRAKAVEVTEYMTECRGTSPAWQKTPNRMLRHRAMIQCARYAFGFAGIMESDEFEQWQEAKDITPEAPKRKSSNSAKKDGTDKVFNEIRAELQGAKNLIDLEEVRERNMEVWDVLPSRWAELLNMEYDDKAAEFQAQATPEVAAE